MANHAKPILNLRRKGRQNFRGVISRSIVDKENDTVFTLLPNVGKGRRKKSAEILCLVE